MSKAVRAGVGGGILAGVVMAIWLTSILWLTGTGFWTLLNLIANTFWRAAPLGPTFSGPAVIIGLIVHVLMSVLFGVMVAAAAWWLPAARSTVIAGGAIFGSGLWAVMQYGIWRAADPAAARIITPWMFLTAHLIFGLITAAIVVVIVPDEEKPSAARVRSVLQTGHLFSPASRHQHAGPAASETVPHTRTLTARNVGGMRTLTRTSAGLGVVTDEPTTRGGTGTAPTPLETVIAALCGCIGATFAEAAREIGFGYEGIDFEASFTVDSGGEAAARTSMRTVRVQVLVRGAQPDAWLPDVAKTTERRSPVRNLLADAGVEVELTWPAAAQAGKADSYRSSRAPEYLPRH